MNLRLRTRAVPSSLLFARDYKVMADVKFDGPNELGVYKCTGQGEYIFLKSIKTKNKVYSK